MPPVICSICWIRRPLVAYHHRFLSRWRQERDDKGETNKGLTKAGRSSYSTGTWAFYRDRICPHISTHALVDMFSVCTWPVPSKSWNRWLLTRRRRHNSTSRWVIHTYGYMTYIEYGRESWNSWLFTRRRRRRWHNRASRWLIHRSGHLKSLHALKPSVLCAPFYTQPPSSHVEIALVQFLVCQVVRMFW